MPIAAKCASHAVTALGFTMGLLAVSGPMTALLGSKAQAQAASAGQLPSTITAAGITLRSATMELPAGGQVFPGNASAQVINSNCLGCHSAEMVLTQPALSLSTWREEIGKMRTAYKAPVAEGDVPAIVAYLISLRGNE